jgi:hypothetical protein
MPSRARQIDRGLAKLPSIPKALVRQCLTGRRPRDISPRGGAAGHPDATL